MGRCGSAHGIRSATSSPTSGSSRRAYPDEYPRLIVRAEGAHVWDAEGRMLLDAGGHLGACQIGHGRREIGERIARQVGELDFIALDSGLSHPKAVELAEVLAGLVPVDDPIFSFTSSGSESNELAFKIARAYHARRGDDEPHRRALARRLVPRLVVRGDVGDRRAGVPCGLRAGACRTSSRSPSPRPAAAASARRATAAPCAARTRSSRRSTISAPAASPPSSRSRSRSCRR